MLKRILVYNLIFSFMVNNIAFATYSVIELDFQGSGTSGRLHVIPCSPSINNVSHIEIDPNKRQAEVYRMVKECDKMTSPDHGTKVFPLSSSIVLEKHDIYNFPWELQPKELALYIFNHAVHLIPLGENSYKLELEDQLLNNNLSERKKNKRTQEEDTVMLDVRNSFLKDEPRPKRKNKNNQEESLITLKSTHPSLKWTREEICQKYDLHPPIFPEAAANAFFTETDDPIQKMIIRSQYMTQLTMYNSDLIVYETKIDKFLKEENKTLELPYKKLKTKEEQERKEKENSYPNKMKKEEDLHSLYPEQIEKKKQRQYPLRTNHDKILKAQIAALIGSDTGITIDKNKNGAPGIYVPKMGLIYPISDFERHKEGAFLPFNHVPALFEDWLRSCLADILKENGQSYMENVVSLGTLIAVTFQDIIKKALKGGSGFSRNNLITSFLHHHELSRITFTPNTMESKDFITNCLFHRLEGLAFNYYCNRKKGFDKFYIETSLLPVIQTFNNQPAYLNYENFINDKNTGYKPGMDINDYWETWLKDPTWGQHACQHFMTPYVLPTYLAKSSKKAEKNYIQGVILPTIQKFNSHPAYQNYNKFINHKGTGYHLGLDPNNYWQSWLSCKLYGESARKHDIPSYDALAISLSIRNNFKGAYTVYSALTDLYYPFYVEDRELEDSLLPVSYKDSPGSARLVEYAKTNHSLRASEIAPLGYMIHEAVQQAMDDCTQGNIWDKGEFLSWVDALTLYHVKMAGLEEIHNQNKAYFTSTLLPRLIQYSLAETQKLNKGNFVFNDIIMQDWNNTDWTELVEKEAEFTQDRWPEVLLEYGIKHGAHLNQREWKKAIQAYREKSNDDLNLSQAIQNKLVMELGQPRFAGKQAGLRWGDVKGYNQIRIIKGNFTMSPQLPYKTYVHVWHDGKVMDRDQKEIKPTSSFPKPKHNPESYIPYEEWINWSTLWGECRMVKFLEIERRTNFLY